MRVGYTSVIVIAACFRIIVVFRTILVVASLLFIIWCRNTSYIYICTLPILYYVRSTT